jgi:hypothetical protein
MSMVGVWDNVRSIASEATQEESKPWTKVKYEHDQYLRIYPENVHRALWNPGQRSFEGTKSMDDMIECIKQVGFIVSPAIIDECGNLIDGHRRRTGLVIYNRSLTAEGIPRQKLPCRVVHSKVINPEVLFAILNNTQKKITNVCQLQIWRYAKLAVVDKIAERSEKFCQAMGGEENIQKYVDAGGDLQQGNSIRKIVEATSFSYFKVGMWVVRHFQWRKTKALLENFSPEEIKRFIGNGQRPPI